MANKFKGQFNIELGGEEFTLLPSFDAIVEFEDRMGTTIVEAQQKLVSGDTSFKIIAGAIWAGIYGYAKANQGKCPTFSVVGQKCKSSSWGEAKLEAIKWLSYCVMNDEDIKGLEEPETESTKKKLEETS